MRLVLQADFTISTYDSLGFRDFYIHVLVSFYIQESIYTYEDDVFYILMSEILCIRNSSIFVFSFRGSSVNLIFLLSHTLFVTAHFCAALRIHDSSSRTLERFLDNMCFKLTLLSMHKFHMTLVAPCLIL